MTACPKADDFAALAELNGWDTQAGSMLDGHDMVSVTATTTYGHPDEHHHWTFGIMVAWFRTEHGWRLGDINGHPVGGTAENEDGRRVESFFLRSLRYAKDVLIDPDDLVSSFEKWTRAKANA